MNKDGGPGPDILDGTDVADVLRGFGESDIIHGFGGNDILEGGDDKDSLYGGTGDDQLYGGDDNDNLDGDEGVDQLYGGAGNDVLQSGNNDGPDGLYGGDGDDHLVLDRESSPLQIILNITLAGNQTLADGTIVSSIERLTFQGGSGNDSVVGGALEDNIKGGAGNDTLYGGDGKDDLDGGAGLNNLFGDGGDDKLNSNSSDLIADYLDGGAGNDLANIKRSEATVGYTINVSNPSVAQTFVDGTTMVNVERLDVRTGSGADYLTGGSLRDIFKSGAGNDTLSGGGGDDLLQGDADNDWLDGGAGNDTLDGGVGLDTATYSTSSTGIVANLALGTVKDGLGGNDTVTGVEQIVGSATGNDHFTGGAGVDYFVGLGGSDFIASTGAGSDVVNGGSGFDTASYYDTGGAVLNLGTTYDFVQDGLGGIDTILEVEQYFGSNTGRDVFYGNAAANTFFAFGGNDYVSTAGAGPDYLDGGTGFDTLSYYASPKAVVVNLGTQTASDGYGDVDTVIGWEEVYGSNTGSDTIVGDSANNALWGFGGNDILVGGLGADQLNGGLGNDIFGFSAADLQPGVWDVISDFHEVAGTDFDRLYFTGVSGSTLLVSEAYGGVLISTQAAGGLGGIFIANFTASQLADQLIFA